MSIRSFLIICCLWFGLTGQAARAQSLSAPVDISFGQMVVGGAGSVTIPSSSDTRTQTGLVALVGGPFAQRAAITITHTPGLQVTISVPPSLVMAGANAPTLTVTVEGGTVQTIPPGGVLTVYMGGTVTFATSGSFGPATAVIPVTVDPL